MKCNMMFKRWALWAVLIVLVLAFPVCAEEQPQSVLPEEPGTILLVHPSHPTQQDIRQIEYLVTMGTAMGKTVDYGTPEQCESALENYEYVMLYQLEKMDRSFGAALKESGANVLVLGGATLRQYLTRVGGLWKIQESEPQKNGTLQYTFPSGEEYSCITSWKELFRVQSDGYESGIIQAGNQSYPFCVQVGNARFIPITDYSQTLVRAAMMQELTWWMWPYQDRPRDRAQFLVLDSVYPFMPASELLEIVKEIEKCAVPYVISVMPLSNNNEYPAMTEFCQVLAYAQSSGASIVLHAPIIHKTEESVDELYEKLTDMTLPYLENGVYPVGIEVPASWLNQEVYLEVLKRYTTVFVYDDGGQTYFDLDAHTSLFSRQGHQTVYPRIDLDQNGISQLQCYSSATYVDCGSDAGLLLRYAEIGKRAANSFADLRDFDHLVWLNNHSMSYQSRMVYLDGKLQDTVFQPVEYDVNFDFQRSPLKRMSVDLRNQNQFLLGVVVFLMIAFLSGIGYARRQMRKHFLFKKESEEKES